MHRDQGLAEPPRYVAAFRTYAWNDGIAELAKRFFEASPGARQVVLADQTRGILNIPEFEVISHTDDTTHLGLPRTHEENSLWFNVDYGLYILRHALPEYDYYLTSESDLAVNINLLPMMIDVETKKIDFVAHELKPSTPDWHWHENGSAVFDKPWRVLLFFMVMSARAIDLLYEKRREQGIKYSSGNMSTWPFCEPFVSTVLKMAGMRFAEISDFADTSNLRFRPRLSLDDPRANVPGSLAHSVLNKSSYIKAVISDLGAMDWFVTNSQLKEALIGQKPSDYATLIEEALVKQHEHAALQVFLIEMAQLGLKIDQNVDLAVSKPAISSSVSQWSRFKDTSKDAAGAVSLCGYEDYSFHTSFELEPWWAVDLLKQYVIDEIAIVNRVTYSYRFRHFKVEGSVDGVAWVTRYLKVSLDDVSADPSAPFLISFSCPFVARQIKITLFGEGLLHLQRVRIFGREIVSLK